MTIPQRPTWSAYREPDYDDRPDLSRTYFTVVWDYVDGDCDDFPWQFETREAAEREGEDWVIETLAQLRLDADRGGWEFPEEGGSGWPTYWIVRHEVQPDGGKIVYDDESGHRLYSLNPDGERFP
jgi:hypothetical protein